MSPAFSANRRLRRVGLQKPWGTLDGLLSLYLIVAIPAVISLWLLVASRNGWLSNATYNAISGDSVAVSTAALLVGLVVEFGILYYISKRYKLTIRDFGLRKFNYKKAFIYTLVFYLIFAVIIYFVYLFITVLAPSINLDEAQKSGFEFGHHGIGLLVSGVATVLLAPVIEEIYFRGFLLPAFSRRSFLLGATVSSLFFGILHFQLNIAIYTFIFGLFLSYMYYRLGSIVPGIMLHILNNLVAFLLILTIR